MSKQENESLPLFVKVWVKGLGRHGLFGLNYDRVPDKIYDWLFQEESNAEKLHKAWITEYGAGQEESCLVILPEFVAKWLEDNRDCRLDELYHKAEANLDVYNWVFPKNDGLDNTSLLARAYLEGYSTR